MCGIPPSQQEVGNWRCHLLITEVVCLSPTLSYCDHELLNSTPRFPYWYLNPKISEASSFPFQSAKTTPSIISEQEYSKQNYSADSSCCWFEVTFLRVVELVAWPTCPYLLFNFNGICTIILNNNTCLSCIQIGSTSRQVLVYPFSGIFVEIYCLSWVILLVMAPQNLLNISF